MIVFFFILLYILIKSEYHPKKKSHTDDPHHRSGSKPPFGDKWGFAGPACGQPAGGRQQKTTAFELTF